jgi:hypothetical protein
MPQIVYSIYADSLFFLRKNIVVTLPFLLNGVLNFLLENWKPEGQSLKFVIQLSLFLFAPSLIDSYLIIFAYTDKGIIKPIGSIWLNIKRYYERAFFLCLLGGAITFLASSPFICLYVVMSKAMHSIQLGWLYPWVIVFGFLFYGGNILGLRFLILHDDKVIASYKAGFRELRSAFPFHFSIYFVSVLIFTIPSLILSWNLSGWNVAKWLNLFLVPILGCLTSVVCTYAFLRNQKKV